MDIACFKNIGLTTVNEYEVEKILKNDKIMAGYRDINRHHQGLTDQALGLFTKRKFVHKNEIIGKSEHDVFDKQHWKFIDLYENHHHQAQQQGIWHGIELAHFNRKPFFVEVIKKAVIDRQGKIIGTFYYGVQSLNQSCSQSIIELLQFINPWTDTKNLNFEFFQPDTQLYLTDREMECLFYTLRGKTAKAIARILHISSKTVEFHIEHLKKKFNCHSKPELISKAIELGYLDKIPKSFFINLG